MRLVAAVGDIHGPKFLDLFREGLDTLKGSISYDLTCLLFAGDIVFRGHINDLHTIIETLDDSKVDCPIISCFGNEEYEEIHDSMRETFSDRITFLSDESFILTLKDGKTLGIVGSKGSLDQPTWWQSRNIPNIRQIYFQRIQIIGDLLQELETDFKILLTHYAPTFETLGGERRAFHQQLGSKKLENIIITNRPDAVIHAHAHNGKKFALLRGVPIYNVSLPLNQTISIIKLPRPTISDY
ncbi:MAG: metallophosphoesterase [Candidatus Hodarchaeota archaeon]